MEYINSKDFKIEYETVVTFGKFDGIHKGHKLLIENARKIADENNLKMVLCTFDMSNWQNNALLQITTNDEKIALCKDLGVDILLDYPFDSQIASMAPEEFISEFVKSKLNAKYIVVGSDWHFGKNRAGDIELLDFLQNKYSYEAIVIDKITYDGNEISSTWIREELKNGRIQLVNQLLGYDYFLIGEVVHGKQIGRTLNFPTINQKPDGKKLLPKFGVYASYVEFDCKKYKSVTNIGIRPTIDNDMQISVETYIFDFNEYIYGKIVKLSLLNFIREEHKFSNVLELKKQIEEDLRSAKIIHEDSNL